MVKKFFGGKKFSGEEIVKSPWTMDSNRLMKLVVRIVPLAPRSQFSLLGVSESFLRYCINPMNETKPLPLLHQSNELSLTQLCSAQLRSPSHPVLLNSSSAISSSAAAREALHSPEVCDGGRPSKNEEAAIQHLSYQHPTWGFPWVLLIVPPLFQWSVPSRGPWPVRVFLQLRLFCRCDSFSRPHGQRQPSKH